MCVLSGVSVSRFGQTEVGFDGFKLQVRRVSINTVQHHHHMLIVCRYVLL